MVWLPWPRTITIMIRHWVVNWRANRVKDAPPRDWTVHGPWHLCFWSEMLSTWFLRKREHVCLLIVLKLSALMVVIYLKGTFREFRKWQVTLLGKVEYCVVSVSGFAYHAICQILMLAAWICWLLCKGLLIIDSIFEIYRLPSVSNSMNHSELCSCGVRQNPSLLTSA